MWKKGLSVLLLSVLFVQWCLQPVYCLELTSNEVEAILKEVDLMQQELNTLKISLAMLEKVSREQRSSLAMLEARLQKALQSLENSEADLIQSKKELEIVRAELKALKDEITELNKLYSRQKKEKIIWMAIGISVSVIFTGYVIYKEVKR